MLQAKDFLDVLDLCVGADLGGAGLADIQELAPVQTYTRLSATTVSWNRQLAVHKPKRKHAIVVPAHNAQSGDGDCFGRVSLCQDEGATVGVLAAGIVCILQLAHSWWAAQHEA
jgi:hypothetical protein